MSGVDERPWQVKAQLVEPLSKRELFAAMAMQALASNPEECTSLTTEADIALESRIAVQMADALIAELARTAP